MGRSEITAICMALICVMFGMGTIMLRDYLNNSHEEQMARIEVVRIQEAAKMQVPEQINKPLVTKAALQRAFKRSVGGSE